MVGEWQRRVKEREREGGRKRGRKEEKRKEKEREKKRNRERERESKREGEKRVRKMKKKKETERKGRRKSGRENQRERERGPFFSMKRKNLIYCWLSVGLSTWCENEGGMAEKGLVADDDHPSSYSERRGRRMNFWTGFLLCSPGRGC